MSGGVRRRDAIIRMIKFIKLFYDLKPKSTEVTIQKIRDTMQCSRGNARHWIDVAGFELPICEIGTDRFHDKKGPAGKTYGILHD